MKRLSRLGLLFLFLLGCVEPYEFIVKDGDPLLVVEGWISDKSLNETLQYPSFGRNFIVKLSYTGDVTNSRSKKAEGASVNLVDDLDNVVPYYETQPGTYIIVANDFRAEPGRQYKLQVILANDDTYESSWERLPEEQVEAMGEIGFTETEKLVYKFQRREKFLENVKGIYTDIQLPAHGGEKPLFYKWDFEPHWIFIAPLPSVFSPVKKCWATGNEYLSNYSLLEDHNGGYKKDLFFIETILNERILEDFTVLIRQQVLSEDYFFYLKEMQEQTQSGLMSDKPPFNLTTNIRSVNSERQAIGYFSVVKEQATRWYFNRTDLSYVVESDLKDTCDPPDPGPFVPPPGCESCLDYGDDGTTNIEPYWWR